MGPALDSMTPGSMTLDHDADALATSAPRVTGGMGGMRAFPTRVAWPRWLGPLLAALVVLIAAAPGLLRLPPLDRDESRFAQATAQMLESGDFVNIRFQEEPRDKKPVGIHWLQAASVSLLSSAEERKIWAFRIPSLLGAMLAAAACAWGAQRFWGRPSGAVAGAVFGGSILLSSEAFIGATDAALCGAVTVSMAALGRLYGASRGIGRAEAGIRWVFWAGVAAAILLKGPVGPLVVALSLAALWIADRELRWARSLGWSWGLLLVLAIVGPWAVSITVATDGAFWTRAVEGDLAPKLARGHEGHGAPPGLHALLSPVLLFPATLLLPAALVAGWKRRAEPGVRFALAWLVPGWLMFELLPTKLAHYPLPMYGALAWLAAAALATPVGRRSRWIGAGLSALVGLLFATVAILGLRTYGDASAVGWAASTAALYAAAGVAGAILLMLGRPVAGLIAAGGLGVLGHAVISGGLAPALKPLWTSPRVERMLQATELDPRNGVTPGPVAITGFAEPSLVFLLGTTTDLADPAEAAQASADGQPVLVEKRQDAAFRRALAERGARARPVGEVKGYNYSVGRKVDLTLWRPAPPPEPVEAAPAPLEPEPEPPPTPPSNTGARP